MGFHDEVEGMMGGGPKTEPGTKVTKTIKVSLKRSKVGGSRKVTPVKEPPLPRSADSRAEHIESRATGKQPIEIDDTVEKTEGEV